jgi:hypothetical protein
MPFDLISYKNMCLDIVAFPFNVSQFLGFSVIKSLVELNPSQPSEC